MSDVEFVDGLFVKKPHENAPTFVKFGISIKRADLGNWLRGKDDEWINIQVKESKNGKWYCSVDTWQPENKSTPATSNSQNVGNPQPDDEFGDQIPF